MAVEQNPEKYMLDSLYCEEEEDEKWAETDGEESEITIKNQVFFNNISNNDNDSNKSLSLFPLLLLEQGLFWDDGELKSLFAKERETRLPQLKQAGLLSLSRERKEAVEWALKVSAHYGFSPLTTVLAVNYLDRFLFGVGFRNEKPWMYHLLAVACLSLAAKVEETEVPLLLDLQVGDAKYYFEAKTIQRMELLVLSGLKWRMNPVTPLSFLDHIIRRLGLKTHVHWEFLKSCETLLLSVIHDPRFFCYLPSVLATATLLHVIHEAEPCNAIVYENQLLGVLKIGKEEVYECYGLISSTGNRNPQKHKLVESNFICCDDGSSDDSWTSMASSCISYSHHEPILKNSRTPNETSIFEQVFCGSYW